MLLAVPNISEGRDLDTVAAVGTAYEHGGARLLDTHSDPDHHRSVHTLAGEPGALAMAVVAGAREAIARIDVVRNDGRHPHVGAIDVAPVVFTEGEHRGAAIAEALVLGHELGALGLPVYLYGLLAKGRTRAELRSGGIERLRLTPPDFGPREPHPTAGAVLVAARPPLVAFNLELAPPATEQDARRIAAAIREGGTEGLPGVRAIGLSLPRQGRIQVSTNVEDHRRTPLRVLVAAVAAHAEVMRCELVGLAPAAAFEGLPGDVQVDGRRTIEEVA